MTVRISIATTSILLAGALLTPLAAMAAPSRTAAPKALSLTLTDVRHVYGSSFRPFMSNTYKPSPTRTCGADYTGGYLAMFGNFKRGGAGSAVVSVEGTVFAYANSRSTACASKNHGVSLATIMGKSGAKVHGSALGGVGDSAYVFTINVVKAHGYSVMVWFARGTHIAMITVSAVGSAPAPSGAINLAKAVDGRIQAAG
jgi:hypothetical protein